MADKKRSTDPALQAIFDLAEHLTGGRRIPEASRTLLMEALNTSIASGFETSLYAALGLKTWGGTSPVRKLELGRRDRRLLGVWATVPEWSKLPPPAAAKLMAASAKRYQSDRWPRESKSLDAPAAEPAATWWKILRSGDCIPGERRMAQILHSGNSSAF